MRTARTDAVRPLHTLRAPVDQSSFLSAITGAIFLTLAILLPVLWSFAPSRGLFGWFLLVGWFLSCACAVVILSHVYRSSHYRRFFLFEDHLIVEEHDAARGYVTTRIPFGAMQQLHLDPRGRIRFRCAMRTPTADETTPRTYVMVTGRLHAEDVYDLMQEAC